MLKIKKVYEPAEDTDGRRILIDRLWPRGISKTEARIDGWLKDLAPSTELREWFGRDPEKWEDYKNRYLNELSTPEKTRLMEDIACHARYGTITLVYGAMDTEYNDTKVLEEFIGKSWLRVRRWDEPDDKHTRVRREPAARLL